MADWLKELPPASRLVLHGDVAVRAAAASAWGVAFAEEPCRSRSAGSRATLWMGPDEYLLLDLAPAEAPGASIDRLERAIGAAGHALVDISQRQLAFEVAGPDATLILNGGCPLDLDAARFPVGMCTRTLFAKADILLWRTDTDTFHLEVWRSFRDYLTAVLREIATEF
jgi:sarcosine oxidase subunit gamma